MTLPTTIGFPQVILFLLLIAGIGFLMSAIGSMHRKPSRRYIDEDGNVYHHRRRFRWGHGVSGVFLLIIAVMLLWASSLVQTYLGLSSDIRVARVHATPIANIQHLMSVDLVLYDSNGHQISSNTYAVSGDEWMLEGDIIKFPIWLNILGFHSGYKLTRLEGRFDDPDLERNSKHTVIELNGGDDNFFKFAQQQPWVNPLVDASYGSGTFLQPDGKTYDVYVSQTGLYAKPALSG